jgi:hypothetical protein
VPSLRTLPSMCVSAAIRAADVGDPVSVRTTGW